MPSKSKAQQRFMGMVHACKKSDYKDCASDEVEDTARGMKAKDAKDFASTKHKGLPDKKEKNEMKDLIKQWCVKQWTICPTHQGITNKKRAGPWKVKSCLMLLLLISQICIITRRLSSNNST